MNIIQQRQEQRIHKISQMQNSIKKSAEPDLDKLVMMCCKEWGISIRTAKEYLKIALFNIEHET